MRPPSIPGLIRCSGRTPALPYPPIKPSHCTAGAGTRKKGPSILEKNSAKFRGFGSRPATILGAAPGVPHLGFHAPYLHGDGH